MGKYIVKLSKRAIKELKVIKRSGRKSQMQRVKLFLQELEDDPRSGIGMPEHLKYFEGDVWSRRLSKKDRLVYEIYEDEVLVVVVQVRGHYEDK